MNRLLIIAALMLPWGSRLRATDPVSGGGAGAGDVRPVIKAMREEISARPSRVLIAVEDALTMNEQAACEIVKEAITSTKADARLVGEIVFTALEHAPAMAAVIVECAVRVSPHSAPQIEAAMNRALGKSRGKGAEPPKEEPKPETEAEPVLSEKNAETEKADSGKEPSGKGAAAPAPASPANEDDFLDGFLPGSVGVGGIYLIAPGRGPGPCFPGGPCCSGELSPSCLRP